MTIWKTIGNDTYEYFELDTPASNFGLFEPIVNIWQSKRVGLEIPAWKRFDFYDFVGWHGKISKFTIDYNPFGYKSDIFGEDFVTFYGEDWTNRGFDDIKDSYLDDPEQFDFYEMTCTKGLIAKFTGHLSAVGRKHIEVSFLELPLSSDGKTVTETLEITL